MTSGDLAALPAVEIAGLVGRGQASPVEVVQSALDRIERHNPTLNAVVTLNERALDDAHATHARNAVAGKC